jgi:hypothetical protein
LGCKRVARVAAEFRGDKSLDAGGLGCLDETEVDLSGDDADAESVITASWPLRAVTRESREL